MTEETPVGETEALLEAKQEAEEDRIKREAGMSVLKNELDVAKKAYDDVRSRWHATTIDIERKKNGLKALDEEKERKLVAAGKLSDEVEAGKGKLGNILKEIAQRSQKITDLERDYEELKRVNEKHLERFEELKGLLGTLHMEQQTFRETIEALGKEIERIRSRRENTDKDFAVHSEKLATVLERLQTTYNIENPEGLVVQTRGDIEEERDVLIKEIATMGEINFRAEKEYQELQERTVFLEKQKEDLKKAMESLKKTITKIDVLTKELFAETFDKISNAFTRFADRLFKGGKGQLMINQESGGIDMFVQPPGKKTLRMELLSGGEKALICLALLLALMDTRPSPFALMDEIDAPLDDANLVALLDIMKTMSAKTQILFITHNRITMEGSDAIYGITMEEQGISKTVSVKL
jgi:chromosome segregation protein